MRVFIGADHRGFQIKEHLRVWLKAQNIKVEDQGAMMYEKEDDYPVYGKKVAEGVVGAEKYQEGALGIVICGGGTGIAIATNKVPGVRCGQGFTVEQVVAARNDDDINVLSLAADFHTEQEIEAMVHAFVTTPFSGKERHVRRISQIANLEKGEE